jgi:hypothetical protein
VYKNISLQTYIKPMPRNRLEARAYEYIAHFPTFPEKKNTIGYLEAFKYLGARYCSFYQYLLDCVEYS